MNISFSSLDQYNVVDATVDPAEINGVGGYAAPQIWIPFRIHVSHGALKAHQGFEFITLSGQLSANSNPIARAMPVSLSFTIQPRFKELKNQYHCLEFPMDNAGIAALEKLRNGGDLSLRVDARIEVMQLRALNLNTPGPLAETVWGQVVRHQLHANIDLVVPRDVWIKRVLRGVGFGIIHLIEMPAISIEQDNTCAHAFEALRQANLLHKEGRYGDAVGKCRTALEEFFEYPEVTGPDKITRRVPKLKSSWETKLGRATYEWLNSSLAALKAGTNKPHHLASATYSQFDSQMMQMIATAVVAYAARHDPPEGEK